MKILAMEATNLLQGMVIVGIPKFLAKVFVAACFTEAPCCVETFVVSLEEICPKDFLEAV
jgi:hypothetical protein